MMMMTMGNVQCSAKCGDGTQRRDVFCGDASGDDVVVVADNECDDRHRPTSEQNCTATLCPGVWLAGPFGKVTNIKLIIILFDCYFTYSYRSPLYVSM